MMRTRLLFISCLLLSVTLANGQNDRKEYLKKVLNNLEKIESATYYTFDRSWEPGIQSPRGCHDRSQLYLF